MMARLKMFLLGVLALVSLSLVAAQGRSVCGQNTIFRNGNRTCPARAVCADVFQQVRDWYNGTRCEETRVLQNCMCPGGMLCPVNDPSHMLYASKNHKRFVCQPACTLPWCANVQFASTDRRGRPKPVTALSAEQRAPEFGYRTYYRLDCRCPRHYRPYDPGYGVHRSVQAFAHQYNQRLRIFSTLYSCTTPAFGREESVEDPCARP